MPYTNGKKFNLTAAVKMIKMKLKDRFVKLKSIRLSNDIVAPRIDGLSEEIS